MYAIIESSGKQYKVSPGDIIQVEKLSYEKGTDITIDKVLMIKKEDKILYGSPYINGAKVIASLEDTRKGRKIIIFKQKPRKNYRRLRGHRQYYSKIKIKEIISEV